MTAWFTFQPTLTGTEGGAELLTGLHADPSLTEALGFSPVLGSMFTPEDDEAGVRLAGIGHELWTRRFGMQAGVVGRTLLLDGASYTVTGDVRPALVALKEGGRSGRGPSRRRSLRWLTVAEIALAFGPSDGPEAPPVAVVNRALAEKYFPTGSPLGREVRFWSTTFEIVGVAADVRFMDLAREPVPAVYASNTQLPMSSYEILVRATGGEEAALEAALEAVREVTAGIDADRPTPGGG